MIAFFAASGSAKRHLMLQVKADLTIFFPPAHFLYGSCLKGDAKNSTYTTKNKQKTAEQISL